MSKYSNPEYWEERYRSSDTIFDWFLTYDNLKPIIQPLLQPADQIRVLIVGCGNSRLSACLYEHLGIKNITNVDISPTVIGQMQRRYAEMDKMQWICLDLLTTPIDKLIQDLCPNKELFDFVIDKGLVDCILGGGNSFHNVHIFNQNISNLLKKGGSYIAVSYGSPETRIDHFRRKKLFFEVEHRSIEKPMFCSPDTSPTGHYHVYIMVKKEEKMQQQSLEGGLQDDDSDEDDFYDRFMSRK
ncbi:unnamed protein product [Phytomonas sp. Hart1]|nr:unnamed protein product [Phytomonas sp. Hart1]|eukprot:CCW69107.1 unnamed protein product [Phytomonas sp. isolate Hart1]